MSYIKKTGGMRPSLNNWCKESTGVVFLECFLIACTLNKNTELPQRKTDIDKGSKYGVQIDSVTLQS